MKKYFNKTLVELAKICLVEYLSPALIYGRLLTLPSSIAPGLKGMPRPKFLPYLAYFMKKYFNKKTLVKFEKISLVEYLLDTSKVGSRPYLQALYQA